MTNNELIHYGILGMKWGVRRTEAQLARARGKKESSDDSETKNSAKNSSNSSKKSIKDMSDDELRRKLNRIQLEEQYEAALARQNPKKSESRVKKVLSDLGEKAVRDVGNKLIDKAISEAFKEAASAASDTITDYRVDLSKVGDKALSSIRTRVENERAITQAIREIDK